MKIEFNELLKANDRKIFDGLVLCFKNSEDLYKSALTIKRKNKFGTANSLYILSFEELITSIVLLDFLVSEKIERENFRSVFESSNLHKTKHSAAIHIKETIKFIKINSLNPKIDQFNSMDEFIEKKKLSIKRIEKEIDIKNKSVNKWFNEANTYKNKGFYIGYNANSWSSPEKVTESVFLNSINETKLVRGAIRKQFKMILTLVEQEIPDFISFMKEFKIKISK
jgi:AbiV family abortive infection protein